MEQYGNKLEFYIRSTWNIVRSGTCYDWKSIQLAEKSICSHFHILKTIGKSSII